MSDAPGCCWHPEPPLDEKGRRAGDCCGDELWHLQINSGGSKPALELWTFGLRVGKASSGSPSSHCAFVAFPAGKKEWEKRCAGLRIAPIPGETGSRGINP